MRPCQRKLRRAVIKRGWLPDSRRMTCLAGVTEICRHMIGIRRNRKISRVASVAVGVNQFVIGIHMTRLAGRREVSAGESEPGRAVIEC